MLGGGQRAETLGWGLWKRKGGGVKERACNRVIALKGYYRYLKNKMGDSGCT